MILTNASTEARDTGRHGSDGTERHPRDDAAT